MLWGGLSVRSTLLEPWHLGRQADVCSRTSAQPRCGAQHSILMAAEQNGVHEVRGDVRLNGEAGCSVLRRAVLRHAVVCRAVLCSAVPHLRSSSSRRQGTCVLAAAASPSCLAKLRQLRDEPSRPCITSTVTGCSDSRTKQQRVAAVAVTGSDRCHCRR